MAVLTKREKTIDRAIGDAAVKAVVRVANGKKATTQDVTAFTTAQVKTWTTIDGVLNQSGDYKGKRFRGAKDHTPEANLAVLDMMLAQGTLPDITD